MFHLLVLAAVLSASVADEVAEATAGPQYLERISHQRQKQRLLKDLEQLRTDFKLPSQPKHLDDPYRQRDDEDRRGRNRDEAVKRYRIDDRKNRDDKPIVLNRKEAQWWTDKDRIDHDVDDHDDQDEITGPVILRGITSHDKRRPDIARQNKIIENVYSPDYAEKTWIIDYRYQKSGGRDYVRGPGGQILILPKGIKSKEPKEFKDYDELIEHLRKANLAERTKPSYFMPLGQEAPQHRDYKHERPIVRDENEWYY